MKVERIISWFDSNTEELAGEKNIDHISLTVLKNIFNPPNEDYLMYNPYDIGEKEADVLRQYIDLVFEFDRFIYQIDYFQAE